jgi:hypothetical protein
MLKMTATQQLATSLAIIFALLYAAVTTIRSESSKSIFLFTQV